MMVVRQENNRMAANPGDFVNGAELGQVLDQLFQDAQQHEGGVLPMSPDRIQALETKVVNESTNGNCPVCVDPFQIGDQESLFYSCCSLAAMPPTSTAAIL